MIFKGDSDEARKPLIHVPWVYVDDIEDHFHRSTTNGATMIEKLDSPWGLPFYVAEDLEGNRWTFLQARPTMH
jgi:uncharacterized glyoxalase superfamily protein PhnB